MDGTYAGGFANSRACWQSYPKHNRTGDHVSDHIMSPGGVCPIQSKMFSNVSCSVNTVPFMLRASEILEPIMRMTMNNKVAGKIGLPYPDYNRRLVGDDLRCQFNNRLENPGSSTTFIPGDYEWKAREKWRKQATKNEKEAYESDLGDGREDSVLSPIIAFWEPLNLGCFSCIPQVMNTSDLPEWHPYKMSGVGIPNVNRIVINAQLGPNFAGNMCCAVSRGLRANGGWDANAVCSTGRVISLHELSGVELFATVYKPPALWTGSQHAQYLIPTWACER